MKFSQLRESLTEPDPDPDSTVPDSTGDSSPIPPGGVELDDFCADPDVQLQNAVYMLQRAKLYLAFFAENNQYHKFLTKKSKTTLIDIVDEIEDFLGDYG